MGLITQESVSNLNEVPIATYDSLPQQNFEGHMAQQYHQTMWQPDQSPEQIQVEYQQSNYQQNAEEG